MPMSRSDAAGQIGAAYVFLREDMKHLAKGTYNADDHNPCIAYVEFTDGSTVTLFAYSDSSKMNSALKAFYEIPDSSAYGDHFGLTQMQRAHTEPKLLNFVMNKFPSVGPKRVSHVTLATTRDPCSSCSKVIKAYRGWFPGTLTVHGFNAQNNDGMPDLSGTIYG